ncbi:MAG: DUF2294 domain-containing protein [Fibrobacterota bacterium]
MRNPVPKGDAEHQISQAIIKFEQEYMGRGPEDTRTLIFDDIIFVRLRGVLTPAEKQLANTEDSQQGRSLIKQVRQELLEKARPLLERIVVDITGCEIISLHTDISIATGERIIVFTLARALKFKE